MVRQSLKTGRRKALTGVITKTFDILTVERKVYDARATKSARARQTGRLVDVQELFAGAAEITKRSHLWGLVAGEPVDWVFGWDLRDPRHRKLFSQHRARARPLCLGGGPNCTPWCSFNYNINYKDRPEELHQMREEERPVLRFTVKECWAQEAEGGVWFLENPASSAFWDEPEVIELVCRDEAFVKTGDLCPFNVRGRLGKLIKGRTCWASNCLKLVMALGKDCVCLNPQEDHEIAESGSTWMKQVWSPELADTILEVIRRKAEQDDPFHSSGVGDAFWQCSGSSRRLGTRW